LAVAQHHACRELLCGEEFSCPEDDDESANEEAHQREPDLHSTEPGQRVEAEDRAPDHESNHNKDDEKPGAEIAATSAQFKSCLWSLAWEWGREAGLTQICFEAHFCAEE
jgi:hypothetical protein